MLPYQFRPYPVAHAEILLDTSASVDTELLRAFVKGVKALMQEDAVIRVGCFDTRFYGFREIRSEADIDALELRGAGGTNFTVAVNAFTGDAENQIIFTDGYAEMPEQRCDALWVVYGTTPIHPKGGRVIYAKPPAEKEKHEIDFLIT
jgi:predicted metal-dependent peptidase